MVEFRSGFVCLVGRPNTGKSTLTNALVGSKVAITSSRPQTTRHTIRGIVHREDFQIVLVDTPGLHRPRTLLGKRLNELVRGTYSEVDVIGLCIPADETIGPGDRWIYEQIRAVAPRTTLVVVVTKMDKVAKDRLAAQLVAVDELAGEHAAAIIPVSATTGEQVVIGVGVGLAQAPASADVGCGVGADFGGGQRYMRYAHTFSHHPYIGILSKVPNERYFVESFHATNFCRTG